VPAPTSTLTPSGMGSGFLPIRLMARDASLRGSAPQPAKTEPGKEAVSVAGLKSPRASDDAARRRFAAG
jgi:hypothetical protein